MKTLKYLISAAVVALLVGFVGGSAQAQVTGSKHDLRPLTDGTGAGAEICVFCHTPHNSFLTGPLWNRAAPAGPFQMYASGTMDLPNSTGPASVSAGCLSCHDGVTAIDSLKNGTLVMAAAKFTGTAPWALSELNNVAPFDNPNTSLGVDLRDDHPISITYAGGVEADWNATPLNSLPLYGTPTANQVECGSCHNPHDTTTATKFLRISNAGSVLCLSCHKK